MRPRNRQPFSPHAARRHADHRANPLFGVGYRPDYPSITAIAHDEANGGRLFLTTDRPCVLVGGGGVFPPTPGALPLTVGGLTVLEAVEILPVKFRLWLGGLVPRGAGWVWGANGGGLIDPVTSNPLNAAAGDCWDVPGPFAPVPGAAVVATTVGGNACTVTFDVPVTLNGGAVDDAILFDGVAPTAVTVGEGNTLSFTTPNYLSTGSAWAISRQPGYVATPVAWPQAGVF